MFQFRRILVPVDATHLSHRTIDAALTLAERFDAKVTVLFVRHDTDPLPNDDQEVEVTRQGLAELVKETGRRLPEDWVDVELRTGDPVESILLAVEEDGVDLIVMGTHGRRGLVDKLRGSTTERVLVGTTKPMLVIREIDDEERE